MKYFIIAICLLIGFQAKAKTTQQISIVETKQDLNTPVPDELKGATILVQLKDGTIRKMKAEQFKVVPRKQQLKVKETVITNAEDCDVVVAKEPVFLREEVLIKDKNIISLTIKRSLGDYYISQNSNSFHVENKYSAAVGLMYQRNLYKRLYVGLEVDSHKEIGANLGIGF